MVKMKLNYGEDFFHLASLFKLSHYYFTTVSIEPIHSHPAPVTTTWEFQHFVENLAIQL